VEALALRDQYLRDAEDEQIFQKARKQGIVIISKDSDQSLTFLYSFT
jgi:predicted nuclease of predicted toxin-antitoxin system